MHYYQFQIAEYQIHTRHLTPIQDVCYRRLLDWQYLHEKPIPTDPVIIARLTMLNECLTDVEQVLNEFFKQTKDGWINVRAYTEIELYNDKISKASIAGKASAARRKSGIKQTLNDRLTTVQPIKNKELLITNNIKGSRLPNSWVAPREYLDFCLNERPDLDPFKISIMFKDYWCGLAGSKAVKADWFATWRNWVRRQEKNKSSYKNKSNVVTDEQFEGWLNSEVNDARLK